MHLSLSSHSLYLEFLVVLEALACRMDLEHPEHQVRLEYLVGLAYQRDLGALGYSNDATFDLLYTYYAP